MKLLILLTFATVVLTSNAYAKYQVNVTGRNAEEVQENAFKERMDYPIGPLKCSQRCSQWWERE